MACGPPRSSWRAARAAADAQGGSIRTAAVGEHAARALRYAAQPREVALPPAHELDGEAAALDQHETQREHGQNEDGHAQGFGDLEDQLLRGRRST
jgi:hypothetical protein